MTFISCYSRDWYKNRIVKPNIENPASAKASAVCELLVLMIRTRA